MEPKHIEILRQMLTFDEGRINQLYTDHLGNWTFGVGRNVRENPLDHDEQMLALQAITSGDPAQLIDKLLDNDIARAIKVCAYHGYWSNLAPERQICLANASFNLGGANYNNFLKMHSALAQGRYNAAAEEMLRSRWAEQVPSRVKRLAEIMSTGKLPDYLTRIESVESK